jgi:pimeloyl-ACP methyl ester carboxylesterase
VSSATYRSAVGDTPNAGNTTINQATPDYCEVLVDIKPVDATAPLIKSQVNLPSSWNGKKLQFGGGGYNGALITGVQPSRNAGPEVPLPLAQGYLTAGTDSGHQNSASVHPAAFALNKEALANFAYASYKTTHDVSIQLSRMYYSKRPKKSYYMGGSQGGREGMMMAQRYPDDFDGIVSIDPVLNTTGLWTFQNSFGGLQSAPGSWLGTKVQLVNDTVAQACDALDGIADKVVSNYKACTPALVQAAFDAKRCASGADEGGACFSSGQLNALKSTYAGYQFPFTLANGITTYPGYVPGSEGIPNNFARWVAGTTQPNADPDSTPATSGNYLYGSYYTRFFIAQDPAFNALDYNPAAFQARVLELSNLLDATNPDLTAFFKRGGKLILREDLGDKGQSALAGLNYWDAVVAKMGKATVDQFFAAYVATGLGHMSGGVDAGSPNAPAYGTPGRVDLLSQLENWVENGVKPADQMTLTNRQPLPPYAVIASKPMCRYGTYPKFTGTGATGGDQASNYACVSN